jgi:MFS family permease
MRNHSNDLAQYFHQAINNRMTNSYARPWQLVFVLTLAYTVSFLDRYFLNLLVEPIKRAFALSDLRVSLLQGFAFSIFLVVSGLPLGRLIDRSRRLTILSAGVAIWSLATMGCGLVSSYEGLLLCRIWVAAGEATLLPAGASLLFDAVPRKRLGLAFGVFSTGSNLGGGLAFLLGAALIAQLAREPALSLPLIGALAPWQEAFLIIGAPGLFLALWIVLLREPERPNGSSSPRTSFRSAVSFYPAHATSLICLMLANGFAAMSAQAIAAWMPSVLIRAYGYSVPHAGSSFGLLVIFCGIGGVVLGGLIGDRLVARGHNDGRLRAIIAGSLAALPFCAAAPIAGTDVATIALLVPALLFGTMFIGNSGAALQEILPSRLQGLTTAIAVLVANFIGLGLGPTAVAMIGDLVFRDEAKLPAALAIVCVAALSLSIISGVLALAPYRRSLEAFASR